MTTATLPPDALVEISALALRLKRANGPVMRAMSAIGGKIETRLAALPQSVRRLLETGTAEILQKSYRLAGQVSAHPALPDTGGWGHRVGVATGGALGGFGGLGTALLELPATITVFFGAMQKVAGDYGFDPASDDTRMTCLEIFGSGGPLEDDDGVDTSFLSTRLAVNGATVQALVQQVAPTLAAVLGRKLAGQAVPVFGAAAGAGVNLAYLSYYTDMAHIRFGLKRLAEHHGAARVEAQFRAEIVRIGSRRES
ncbi:EcsC family protein [Albidovulum aquaemixtae]|uniref:EcsC family protein n=1 Tax=Albidovulum aquaemixtae TaxID=1542388 RepID=UPI001FE6F651|nr:EcsC family protein [Defluviimonas aquaemixtae]